MADGRWQKTAAGSLTATYGYMETRLYARSMLFLLFDTTDFESRFSFVIFQQCVDSCSCVFSFYFWKNCYRP